MGSNRLPVIGDFTYGGDIETCIALGVGEGRHNRPQRWLRGIARQRVHGRIDRIDTHFCSNQAGGDRRAGSVVGVKVNGQADFFF